MQPDRQEMFYLPCAYKHDAQNIAQLSYAYIGH
jgi:hypothetical protein